MDQFDWLWTASRVAILRGVQVLVVAGIVLAGLLGVVLFVVLPALAIIRARPGMRRMMRGRVDDPPISIGRAFGHWLERNDQRVAQEHRAARSAQSDDLDP